MKTTTRTDARVSDLVVSRFNGRSTRTQEQVARLAERMVRNGFEVTRALWCHMRNERLEVFAGGTRLEAAKLANIDTVPVVVFADVTDDDVVRLAEQDNANDEYHVEVPLLDKWADYHRLAKEEKWTGRRIAQAKGESEATVSERIACHELACQCKPLRKAVSDGLFEEGHVTAVLGVVSDVRNLSPWLTTTQAQSELVAEVLEKHRGSSKGIKPTVQNVREAAKRWKALIAEAEGLITNLDDRWAKAFADCLATMKARTVADVTRAYSTVVASRKLEEQRKIDDATRAINEGNEAQKRLDAEAIEKARILAITSVIQHGDARSLMRDAPAGASLILTDPPYGVAFQSGRRTTTAKKSAIANDDDVTVAVDLLSDVMKSAFERMAKDATALVFTGWRYEPEFRAAIEQAGWTIKGSLVWVKNNHGTGDLSGSFAPKHERIIHAVKGSPKLHNRPADVLTGRDSQNSKHPTEKPRDLLRTLIEATTTQGDLVIDPFAGSGNTLLEALTVGRNTWGCELDPEYFKGAQDALFAFAKGNAHEVA